MRISLCLFIFFSSLYSSYSQSKEKLDEQNQMQKIALDFINSYVAICNNRISEKDEIVWISKQNNLTKSFKSEFKSILENARKRHPELGLGYDPIFNAQDYPENGFELLKVDRQNNRVIVKGKKWAQFQRTIKMKQINNVWFVNGFGIINNSDH